MDSGIDLILVSKSKLFCCFGLDPKTVSNFFLICLFRLGLLFSPFTSSFFPVDRGRPRILLFGTPVAST